MITNLKISFILFISRCNSRGLVPVFCRLTIGKERKQFTTSIFISSSQWCKRSQRVIGKDSNDKLINRKLSDLETQLSLIERQLYDEGKQANLKAIYARYTGQEEDITICQIYDAKMAKMRLLVDKEYTAATIQKFSEVYGHLKAYMKVCMTLNDIPLKRINYSFVKGFEEHLLGKGLKPITINKIIQRLRQIVIYALRCGEIQRDPFIDYKPLKEKKQLVYLTPEELASLESYNFSQTRLEQVKNIYLFSVYTGLAYNEALSLKEEHIIKGFDSKRWIEITRQKTGREVSIPLLPQAEAILLKCSVDGDEYLLPRISNQRVNSYLKEIAEVVGINKKLTHHTARKTFATTILLYNDVPIEIVSKLLGHADIAVTQRSYAEVVNRNISRHISRLETIFNK